MRTPGRQFHTSYLKNQYSLDQLSILQPKERIAKLTRSISHPQPVNYNTHCIDNDGKHFHTDIIYAFVTSEDPTSAPGDGESTDIQLFTRTELQSLPPEEVFDNVREIGQYIFDEALESWVKVPAKNI